MTRSTIRQPSTINRAMKALRRAAPGMTRRQAKKMAPRWPQFHRFAGAVDMAPWLGQAPGFEPHPLARYYPA